MVRRGDPQAECQMSTINKHYCPVSADIKHTSSILLASYTMYTSPASPWLISDFNLLCRPLREGSLLFIYIVRFIYRDGETRREEERRSLSLQTCQRGQGHYEAQLAACPHNCFSQHAHLSPRIAAVTHFGFSNILHTINNPQWRSRLWDPPQDTVDGNTEVWVTAGWWWWARWG